jgi:acyl-coenzyme A thioesterase PaaI-like protein
MTPSLQGRYAPKNRCFGCGPANPEGFQIESIARGDEVVLEWTPQPRHEAIHGFVNGGVLATLLDCHMAWTAAWAIAGAADTAAELPLTVTAHLDVSYLSPTPSGLPLQIRARATETTDRKATVEAELASDGAIRATCRGVFVVAGRTMADATAQSSEA